MSEDSQQLVKSSQLTFLSPKDLERNRENPRILFDQAAMEILRQSIKKVGILVPLIVYQSKDDKKYVILDGERRSRCALDLNLKEVPVNVIAEPNLLTNILTMFNIHNVREQWEITPTALKLEVVMRLSKAKNNKELSALTGLSVPRVADCKKLLQFERKYLDLTLLGDKEERISGDFFVQLHPVLKHLEKQFPKINRKYDKDKITKIMIEKYRKGIITNVTDFRFMLRTINALRKGATHDAVSKAILNVIEQRDASLQSAYEAVGKNIYEMEKIVKTSKWLMEAIAKLDVRSVDKGSEFIRVLNVLRSEIDKVIRKVS